MFLETFGHKMNKRPSNIQKQHKNVRQLAEQKCRFHYFWFNDHSPEFKSQWVPNL